MKKTTAPLPTPEQIAARDLERARKDWRDATRGRTRQEAVEALQEFLKTHGPRGATISDPSAFSGSIYVTARRSFSSEATITISLETTWRERATSNPDAPADAPERAVAVKPKVEINWSGTTRTIPAALAALAVYRDLLDLGASVEAMLSDSFIYAIEKL